MFAHVKIYEFVSNRLKELKFSQCWDKIWSNKIYIREACSIFLVVRLIYNYKCLSVRLSMFMGNYIFCAHSTCIWGWASIAVTIVQIFCLSVRLQKAKELRYLWILSSLLLVFVTGYFLKYMEHTVQIFLSL